MSASDNHEKYAELCAIATSGELSASEWDELRRHVKNCEECREAYRQYCVLVTDAIPLLTDNYNAVEDQNHWDQNRARSRLLSELNQRSSEPANPVFRLTARNWAVPAIAACLVITLGVTTYRFGRSSVPVGTPTSQIPAESVRKLLAENAFLNGQFTSESASIETLKSENEKKEAEVGRLKTDLRLAQAHVSELSAADDSKDQQLRAFVSERDSLAQQLLAVQQSYEAVQEELSTLRGQRSQDLLRAASLQSEVDRLSAGIRQQEESGQQAQEYLAYDRDIRELMGARQLYIADVFDVNNQGETLRPYGRVFYTRGRSLIFYAFDLDQESSLKRASAFQAWGLRSPGDPKPLNLGILYMDSEANRRWILRFDDPERLAEINAVFVTVEPAGGSRKPTGKPLMYASLRHVPNHP